LSEEFFRRMLNSQPTHLTRHDPGSLSGVASRLNPFDRDCFDALRRFHPDLTHIFPLPAEDVGAGPQEDVPEGRERPLQLEGAKERLKALFDSIPVAAPSAFEQELLTLLRRIDRRLAKAFPLGRMKP
jgi:hypothetical protein